ncbi:hypothetical protein BW687_013930 [Pseudomonas graminis]|uniref:hypothetical protein n=1 Tax=Pseudomonas graminis TaxID=158627 RepID=UPI002349BE5A|nr:hypothetical protein [Pseudomonas graminis]MDC6381268.1 hypothetical protein [Pseudomonas graminis]
MFLENFEITHYESATGAHISFAGEPELLFLEINEPSDRVGTEIIFHIGSNTLLQPQSWAVRSANGEVSVHGEATRGRDVGLLGKVSFQDYFYYIDLDDGGVLTHQRLTAACSLPLELESLDQVEEHLLPVMRDYLLLCALAADQRTHIFSWEAYGKDLTVKAWYGDISEQGVAAIKGQPDRDLAVPRMYFDSFISRAFEVYTALDVEQKELVRQSIHRTQYSPHRTVESSILSLFSAIESMVLIHRRQTSLEFTVPSSAGWKKLEKAFRATAREAKEHFPTEDHLNSLLKMLPQLRRVPLDDAFTKCISDWSLDLSDLWAVFGDKPTLSGVRNRLVHGDMFLDKQYDALFVAMDHLEVIAKRLLFVFLKHSVTNTNISQARLLELGWMSYFELETAKKSIL